MHHISIKNFWFLRKSVALALILEKYSLNYFVVSFENGGVYFATAPFYILLVIVAYSCLFAHTDIFYCFLLECEV